MAISAIRLRATDSESISIRFFDAFEDVFNDNIG